MMDAAQVTECLREHGFKVTPQRLAVYDVLGHTKAHPNAEMIYKEIQPKYPMMSLATVYKTLDIFSEIGLVQVLNVGEDSFRYDADTSDHAHIHCTCCGRVDDVFDIDDRSLMSDIQNKTAYRLTGKQMYLYGVCPICQNASQC